MMTFSAAPWSLLAVVLLPLAGCAWGTDDPGEPAGETTSHVTRAEGSVGRLTLSVRATKDGKPASVHVAVTCGGNTATTVAGVSDPLDGRIELTRLKPRACVLSLRSTPDAPEPLGRVSAPSIARSGDEVELEAGGYELRGVFGPANDETEDAGS